VLFRAYEETYCPDSEILKKFPNEQKRVEKTVSFLKSYSDSQTIICLQEVSTSVVNELNRVYHETHSIFTHTISDNFVSSLNRGETCEDEHLVTLAPKDYVYEKGYAHPTSNGYLIVRNDRIRMVNCHLCPQKYTKDSILPYLLSEFGNPDTFIAGDFNEEHSVVDTNLNKVFKCPFYGETYKNEIIDQIIFSNKEYKYETNVIDSNNLSDHRMIILCIL
jgi:hypothetical protein